MQKIIRFNDVTIAVLSNGNSYQRTGLTDEEFNKLSNASTDEEILYIMDPGFGDKVLKAKKAKVVKEKILKSRILTFKGDAAYWKEISMLSLPRELIEAILKAEEEKDEIKLETYRNFWTLMSLNTDEQCRLNLFWFLQRNGLVIARCGFFVAYRNVWKTSEEGVYTDDHTRKMRIKIGEMVTIPREDCNSNQDVVCSSGLICSPVY